MNKRLLLLPLAAIVFTGPKPVQAQGGATDRKVRIEVTTTEGGKTSHVVRELDAADETAIQNALRELGILDEIKVDGDGGNVTINITRSKDGGEAVSTAMRMAAVAGACEPGKCGYLGVSTGPLEEKGAAKEGARVLSVVKGSPAEGAGLKEGDVITAIDGKAIAGPKELTEAVRAHKPGDQVKVAYLREGRKGNASVKLGERKAAAFAHAFGPDETTNGSFETLLEKLEGMDPKPGSRAFLGVTPAEGSEGKGAVIGSVEEGSAAATMGIREGDVVRAVNGTAVESFDALATAIGAMKPGDEAAITLLREGGEVVVKGPLGERKAELHMFRSLDANGDGEHLFRGYRIDGLEHGDREALHRQMDQLRRELTELRQQFGGGVTREVRVVIESRMLSDEEKGVLLNKGVTGLDNELALGDLRTYPNPSNGSFRLEFDVPERGDLRVMVYDATGERVYEETVSNYKGRYDRTLDLGDKANGNYFVVISQNGRSTARKLMKQ